MATLLIGTVISIAATILINKFFGPEGQDILQEGPQLRDLGVSSSAYGQVRPIGFGSFRMGGNMFWSPGLREIVREQEQEQGGKGGSGGGSVTTRTFEYRASFAIGFGEGPAQKITKLWADSKLVYDATGPDTGVGKYRFRFYPGDEEQLPDPLIEADVGVGNAPAYRGEVYIVADDWPLADFGNRIPNLSAEVAFQSTEQKFATALTGGGVVPGSGAASSRGARHPENDYLVYWSRNALKVIQSQIFTTVVAYDLPNSQIQNNVNTFGLGVDGFFYRSNAFQGSLIKYDLLTNTSIYSLINTTGDGRTFGTMINFIPGVGQRVYQWISKATTLVVLQENLEGTDAVEIFDDNDFGGGFFLQDHYGRQRLWFLRDSTSQTEIYECSVIPVADLQGQISAQPVLINLGTVTKNGGDIVGTSSLSGRVWLPIENAMILSYGADGLVKFDIDTSSVVATNPDESFTTDNQYTLGPEFAWGENGGDFISISTDDLRVVNRETVSSFFSGTQQSAWNEEQTVYEWETNSVAATRLSSGSSPSQFQTAKVFLNRTISNGEDLASIITTISERGGLDPADFDASALAGILVDGFVINRQTAVKEALRPLTRAFLFDAVESDFQIKYIRRGGALALPAPIPRDDIGLGNGPDDEPFREIRTQEAELPERVTVVYADKSRDYQQGSQTDKRQRQPSPAVRTTNQLTLNLPIAIEASVARQIAQRQLYISWAERRAFETQLPWTYLALDPGDSVEMELDTETARVRMAEIELGADFTLAIRAVLEDEDADISVLPGDAGTFSPSVVPDLRPTRLFPLNLPLLRNQDTPLQEFSRAYFAMSGFSDGWPGAILFQSRDTGATYQELAAQSAAAAWGVVTTVIPDPVTTNTWNPSQEFDVTVLNGIDRFQSASNIEVLNGANAVAIIRPDGSAEILQFRDATPISDTAVRLSYLLRGRRGTEIESVGHMVGATAVLLTPATTNSFRLELSLIGSAQQLRPVTLGTLIEDAQDVFGNFTGRDLRPYSPAQLAAVQNASDIDLSWRRRTRYNGELRDGTGEIPLNEQFQRYEVDIVRGGTILRTLGLSPSFITTTSATYTDADQTTDGVVSTDVLTFNVYQISAIVGRGSPASVTYIVP